MNAQSLRALAVALFLALPMLHAAPAYADSAAELDAESRKVLNKLLADVPAATIRRTSTAGDETTCPCGHREFLLEGFWAVVDGLIQTVPVEVDALTCPECGREFEAVSLEDGRVVRGEFRGR